MTEIEQALEHLGNVLYFVADIHPDDRNEAIDMALAFYNEKRPEQQVHPSDFGYQRHNPRRISKIIGAKDSKGVYQFVKRLQAFDNLRGTS